MAPILLDTTVLIDALRGRGAVDRIRALRANGDTVCTCAINVEEVVRGLFPREVNDVSRLLDGLRLAPLGRTEGERAGTWRQNFARRGTTLSQADCLVAAAALGVGGRLATGNPRDFPMRELTVDHWPVGE
jgi:predicted nucleic acid-binding protein